jgi:thymidylate kinase
MIVNIRGTGGAGKSTLVRAVMSWYPEKIPHFVEGRKQPMGYTLHKANRAGKPLYVPGHYETACGGCDTIKTLDQIFDTVKSHHENGEDVLFEGMLLCSDRNRITELANNTKHTVVISLTTPIDQCCDNIRKRREAGGNPKPLNESNTRKRYDYEQKQIVKLKQSGVDIRTLVYEDALDTIKRLFEL